MVVLVIVLHQLGRHVHVADLLVAKQLLLIQSVGDVDQFHLRNLHIIDFNLRGLLRQLRLHVLSDRQSDQRFHFTGVLRLRRAPAAILSSSLASFKSRLVLIVVAAAELSLRFNLLLLFLAGGRVHWHHHLFDLLFDNIDLLQFGLFDL